MIVWVLCCGDSPVRISRITAISRGSELEGNGLSQTVLEMGRLWPVPRGLLPLQFFVRLTRLFEAHPDVTSLADRSWSTGAVSLCPLLTAGARDLAYSFSNPAVAFRGFSLHARSGHPVCLGTWVPDGVGSSSRSPSCSAAILRIAFPSQSSVTELSATQCLERLFSQFLWDGT